MPRKKDEDRWIILINTLCDGLVPYEWESAKGQPDRPVTYATAREAQKEIADTIREYMRQFINDEREEMDLCEECQIFPCTVSHDGVITTEEDGVVFSPFEDQAKYGR
jgi:hypothetical protein